MNEKEKKEALRIIWQFKGYFQAKHRITTPDDIPILNNALQMLDTLELLITKE